MGHEGLKGWIEGVPRELVDYLLEELEFHRDNTQVASNWFFQTEVTGIDYAAGFYRFGASHTNFSPGVNYGDSNAGLAAHFFVVTGAVPASDVLLTITGDSISDSGQQIVNDTAQLRIPAGAAVNSYFQTSQKWNGQITITTTTGAPINCNYGFCKYFDFNNRDFLLEGIETVWHSDSGDSASNIEILHHKAEGWTYNAGSTPTPPSALAARNTDHAGNVAHVIGEDGAWKRNNLDTRVLGGDSEGIIFRITSGNAGVGTLSFKTLNLTALVRFV